MYHLANNFHILDAVIYIYHTAPTSNDPKEGGFENTAGKRRKCWEPSFSPFPTEFSTLSKKEIVILSMFIICKCFQLGHVIC